MICPGKMLSLNLINWGCEIAETLQVPIDTKVLNVRWAKPHMNRLNVVVGHKVQCAVSFSQNLSCCFDERLLLVTYALQTICTT